MTRTTPVTLRLTLDNWSGAESDHNRFLRILIDAPEAEGPLGVLGAAQPATPLNLSLLAPVATALRLRRFLETLADTGRPDRMSVAEHAPLPSYPSRPMES